MINDENSIDLLRQHELLLELLSNFDAFCQKNSIEYSLAYGTMLGAVREHGFIPWDDDVDIMMFRNEYNKLIKVIKEKNYKSKWFNYQRPLYLGKLVDCNNNNVWLDIFVLDYVPDNKFFAILKRYTLLMLQGMMKKTLSWKGSVIEKFLSLFTWLLGKVFPRKIKIKLYDSISKWGNKKQSSRVAVYNTIYRYLKKNLNYDSILLSDRVYVPFENRELPIFKNYDLFLGVTYGDYMKRPPQEEQKPTHNTCNI